MAGGYTRTGNSSAGGNPPGSPDKASLHAVGVIGAGAWGTALAVAAGRAGRRVELWGRTYSDLIDLAHTGENRRYLPGLRLSPLPHVTRELADVMQCAMVLVAIPAQQIRSLAPLIALHVRPRQPLILCAKGVERGTARLMSEVMREFVPHADLACLSGPTFAGEVVQGLPTAVTVAADDLAVAQRISSALSSLTFRCYATRDVMGVELCGATKNILAIACGIVAGRGLGDNARSALVTRGLAELRRLCHALGALPETPMGLAGLGDLTLTCTSSQSRNYTLGYQIGTGATPDPDRLAEGFFSASAMVERAEGAGVDMPICRAVDSILNRGSTVDETIRDLLSRPLKTEVE